MTGPVVRARRAGLALLAVQLAALLVWSAVLASRFALTSDFAGYYQAWRLIGAGHLDPYSTVFHYPFWQDHGALVMWPLALLALAWPQPATLLWVQDVALVGAEAAALCWACELCRRWPPSAVRPRQAALVALLGALLIAADPWVTWTASFDVHSEVLAAPFLVLGARDLFDRRSRAFCWLACAMLCGDVVATYVVGLGLAVVATGLLASRRAGAGDRRETVRAGAVVVAMAVAWLAVLGGLHADLGTAGAGSYAALVGRREATGSPGPLPVALGVLRHPGVALDLLLHERVDLFANLAPAGLVGLGWGWVLGPALVAVLESGLRPGPLFATAWFQNLPELVLVPVGTVAVVLWLLRAPRAAVRRGGAVMAVLAALSVAGWAAVWLPRTAGHWLRVSPAAAGVLRRVDREIPGGAPVAVSQGVAGPFAGRPVLTALTSAGSVAEPRAGGFVVLAPAQGVETMPVAVADRALGSLAADPSARLVAHGAGVWAFRLRPRGDPGTLRLRFPATGAIPAWTSCGAAGRLVLSGPASGWHVESTGAAGYVVSYDYWDSQPGSYVATVTLATGGPTEVEVWDATGSRLLARDQLPATGGPVRLRIPVRFDRLAPPDVFRGDGPFRLAPVVPSGNQLEIRVWTPGSRAVVWSLDLERAGRAVGP